MGWAPRVSVIVPTYDRASFLPRALDAVRAQTLTEWELIVVLDGSTDDTMRVLASMPPDDRVRIERIATNQGIGAALNRGLDLATAPTVAYLPDDDVWYPGHLASLLAALDAHPGEPLAIAGVRYGYNRRSGGRIPGEPIQLVQAAHRATDLRWPTREEIVSDDLDMLFWATLLDGSEPVTTGDITCEWVAHADQLHRVLRHDEDGGLNGFRARFRPDHPIRMRLTTGTDIDEAAEYLRFEEHEPVRSTNGLRILLVGELAYNPDRILALEEQGHELFGLWMPNPGWYNTVGPLPFGHVTDVPIGGWQEHVRRIRPDVIYGLLNWQAIPFAHHVMVENPGVPFVWHFKEGPFIAFERGTWPLLADLARHADGTIYCSDEMRDWFASAVPGSDLVPSLVLDGDLPKREWFEGQPSSRLSVRDGEVHTVVPGRPIGLHPPDVATLARAGVHLHFHGEQIHHSWRGWIDAVHELAPGFLHLHPYVDRHSWRSVLSRYDAGWLHVFESRNGGEVRAADWDDLNVPARLATYAAAGLPVLQRANDDAVVATHRIATEHGFGIAASSIEELAGKLHDAAALARARAAMERGRWAFTFDHHVEELTTFFRHVIDQRTRSLSIASSPATGMRERAARPILVGRDDGGRR